jgi:hypothetical protein
MWIDIYLATKSCKRKNGNSFLESAYFLYDVTHIFDFNVKGDAFRYLYWECPIKAFYVNIRTNSLENFLSKVDKKYFPDGVLGKIVVRDFEFGMVPKTIESTEEIDGIKTIRYKIESLK